MKRVLVDTSVWVDHFRRRSPALVAIVELDLVLTHPLVIGELACGTPPRRQQTLAWLNTFETTLQTTIAEACGFIERERLYGNGCGLVDILLLTSTLMTPATQLWTADKRLSALAERFGIAHQPVLH